MRTFPKITITQKGADLLRGGHVWVYADEVTAIDGTPNNGESDREAHGGITDGDLTDVYSPKGRYLGTGFYNSHSKIRVRVVSKNANDRFDEAFWERKLRWAIDYRRRVMGDDFSCCRLIFGEADAFPGLTVDRFGDVLVTEVLSLGIERIKGMLYRLLVGLLREEFGVNVSVLYERNDSPLRVREGMDTGSGFYAGMGLSTDTDGRCRIVENGVEYEVDYVNGQKTGFFLDQKYNRAAIRKIAKGARVLDCFTHTGSFALNAAQAGASHVTAVDISADALEIARRNAEINGLSDRMDFVCSDVFDYLTAAASAPAFDYDLVILDPPAFTKSRDTLRNAIKGYREINRRAMQLLRRGSYLATCSCSHFMTETYFRQMLHNAAEDAGVGLRQIEARQQSPDHPILWNVPETDYLKFYIFQIV
ncbi:MAG: class I SAM-dependent rRNA methyltransferase [Clostridia bacterium]|nr:class I SAM-dependent rRNA methyltransferase [Clostridia bacterium]